jgi:hypothetical protein
MLLKYISTELKIGVGHQNREICRGLSGLSNFFTLKLYKLSANSVVVLSTHNFIKIDKILAF